MYDMWQCISITELCMKYRFWLVIDFLKNLCSLFRLHMYWANCENFCQNIVLCGQCLRIFFRNLAILFSNSSLESEKLKQNRLSLIKSKLTDLNNFIRKRVTAKSNDFTSLLFNGQHSKPYNKIGKHLHLTNSRTTSSEATLPTFPKIALVARKKSALGLV